ncbi:CPBP family intramembrane metalloprotease [Paenibacillus sp. SYP-B3998]|uniref:CPBP family intramembrane metalloprotease n=1 Tax=Paenibacillus sp. SYP-B3998 TaxID=2678564 RepID=A0A6G3ZUT8_9BACL|nr:CPBP family intramembrane glutamic endopeptidase [Paenibacillus sp. SYP-B3998]NEW05973.1 CPBP family intramembrane metalloprotease [Paenibacillus sp. SYP-B3998]
MITVLIPLIILPFSSILKEKVAEKYNTNLYPITDKQQFMFVFVTITVGICEEIIFRGFMQHYVKEFGVSTLWSFLIISVVFGAGHFMQGLTGVISSTLLGLILGYLYYTTGSLLIPILVHILYDAKAIYISRVLTKSHKSLLLKEIQDELHRN